MKSGDASHVLEVGMRKPFAPLARYGAPVLIVLLAFYLRTHILPTVPFGWHPDEATKGLLARDVLAGKYRPVYFTAFTGRDALYVYLEAATFALIGEGILAGRLLSAFIGVLTVAATYALGSAMWSRRVGLLGAGLLAVSLWHLIASRNGYRAIIQPLLQAPVLWVLFREWRAASRQRPSAWPRWVAAGLTLGLTQYTYTAARAFPVLVLAIAICGALLVPALVRRQRGGLALMLLSALIVVIPLAAYFYLHPADLYGRATQISVFTSTWSGGRPWARLGRSVVETVRMFSYWGDPNYRFNIAGQPVFGGVDGLLFYAGLLLCLWRAARGAGPHRLASLALLLWLPIMLLPMTLSAEGLPYYQRAIGILPGVYFLVALPVDAALELIRSSPHRVSSRARRGARALASGLLAALAVWLAVRTHQDYFVAWHTSPRNDDDRRVAMVYAADYLERADAPRGIYLSTQYAQHPTLAFLAPQQYDGIRWFDAQQSLPLPPPGSRATYLMLLETPPQRLLLQRVPDLRHVLTEHDRFGRPVFEVYEWDAGVVPTPQDRSPAIWSFEVAYEAGDPQGLRHTIDLPASFGQVMAFSGHDRSADAVEPGRELELVLHWRLLTKPERNYAIFAHLLDGESRVVAGYDDNRYAAPFWREGGGETLLSYFPLHIAADTPAGEYRLEIGVYHQPSGERLAVYEDGKPVADRLLLRPVQIR